MVRVRVKRTAGKIAEVTAKGHTGSAPAGEDIICAAISMLVQTFYLSLEQLLKINVQADIRDGYLSLALPPDLSDQTARDVTLLAESMLLGLYDISLGYPGFLEVTEE